MADRRPVIGVSGPDRGGYPAWLFTSCALRWAGAKPRRITPRRGKPKTALDGLIIGGGADIEPARYRSEPLPEAVKRALRQPSRRGRLRAVAGYLVSPFVYVLRRLFSVKHGGPDTARDELEFALLELAVEKKLPVLGICRGAQLANVFWGGTLHQDVSSYYVEEPNPWTVFPRKKVEIRPSSRLHELLGASSCYVNSLHRQAVNELGDGIQTAAQEPNGVIQGIERPGDCFFVGVQWHPEYLPQRPEQRRLFRELVRAAKRC